MIRDEGFPNRIRVSCRIGIPNLVIHCSIWVFRPNDSILTYVFQGFVMVEMLCNAGGSRVKPTRHVRYIFMCLGRI